MSRPLALLPALLALTGLAGAFLLIGTHQPRAVLAAVGSVGWDGLLALLATELTLVPPLGAAWQRLCPRLSAPVAVWARMVRDASANCLPLTSIGGLVFGTRELTRHGITSAAATASGAADVTLEFLAQILFVLLGGLLVLLLQPHHGAALPVAAGLLGAILLGLLGIVLQRRAGHLLAALIRRIGLPRGREEGLLHRAGALQQALDALHREPSRLAEACALHLIGWLGSGLATWLACHLLGAGLGVMQAVGIEALVSGIRAAGFFVPASLGVQEGGYLAFGALFGLPADMCLGISLLRRARDLGFGLPVLLAWQAIEWGRLRAPLP